MCLTVPASMVRCANNICPLLSSSSRAVLVSQTWRAALRSTIMCAALWSAPPAMKGAASCIHNRQQLFVQVERHAYSYNAPEPHGLALVTDCCRMKQGWMLPARLLLHTSENMHCPGKQHLGLLHPACMQRFASSYMHANSTCERDHVSCSWLWCLPGKTKTMIRKQHMIMCVYEMYTRMDKHCFGRHSLMS